MNKTARGRKEIVNNIQTNLREERARVQRLRELVADLRECISLWDMPVDVARKINTAIEIGDIKE